MERGTVSSEILTRRSGFSRQVDAMNSRGICVDDNFAEENRRATSQIYMPFTIAPGRLRKSPWRSSLVSDSLGSYLESQNDSLAVWHTACAPLCTDCVRDGRQRGRKGRTAAQVLPLNRRAQHWLPIRKALRSLASPWSPGPRQDAEEPSLGESIP